MAKRRKDNRREHVLSAVKLAARRKALGFTQQEVADRADLLLPNYARMEMADTNPTVDTAVRVTRAMACRVEDVLSD